MLGCRPLSEAEVVATLAAFSGRFAVRNKCLFTLGCKTGFRIAEILSIRVKDVVQNDGIVDRILVSAKHMKGKERSRTVLLHPDVKIAISAWITDLHRMRPPNPDCFLFPSQIGVNRSLSRSQVAKVLKDCFQPNGIGGKLGTHCMRKTFANRVYELLDHDLPKTQRAMGHTNINSTIKYLSFREEDIDAAILAL